MPFPGFGRVSENLRRSTVCVKAGRHSQGSGVIVDPSGLIVTNAHVVASTGPIEVSFWDGQCIRADLSKRDASRDIAILRVPLSGLPAVTLANSDEVRAGHAVVAVGNPMGFQGALTTGVVHAMGRLPGLGPMNWIQADVRLAPGNSGGPLADAHGQVIGINTMIAGGLGLAVPSNAVARRLQSENDRVSLGAVVRPVQVSVEARMRLGMMVLQVIKNGAADLASLMPGDLLIAADGRAFHSIEDLERMLDGAGERIARVEFLRGARERSRTAFVRLCPPAASAAL
jgi:serine protease Do